MLICGFVDLKKNTNSLEAYRLRPQFSHISQEKMNQYRMNVQLEGRHFSYQKTPKEFDIFGVLSIVKPKKYTNPFF